MPHKPGTGVIRGIVSEDGIPSKKRVVLMDRTNFRRLSTITSGDDGDYAFSGLDPHTDDYLLFAVDDDKEVGGNYKDPIIYDRVQPVEAAMGASQVNEWFYLAQQKILRASYIPILASPKGSPTAVDSGTAYGASHWFKIGNAGQVNNSFMGKSPVLPELGNPRLGDGMIAQFAMSDAWNQTLTVWPRVTIEWVLDLTDVVSNPVVYLVPLSRTGVNSVDQATPGSLAIGTGYSDGGVEAYVGYISNRRTIQFGYNSSYGSANGLSNPFSLLLDNNNAYVDRTHEYVVPQELIGTVVHIVASFSIGSSSEESKLYVNGVKVASKYFTPTRSAYSEKNTVHHLILGGSINPAISPYGSVPIENYNNAQMNTSLVALYRDKVFTQAEAAAHFKALFNPVRDPIAPTETGFQYAVKMLRPCLYFPLHEFVDENESISVREAVGPRYSLTKRTGLGTVLNAGSSLVTGRNALHFNLGALTNTEIQLCAPISNAISFSIIAAPERGTLTNDEFLFQSGHHYSNNYGQGVYRQWGIYRNTAGKFVAGYGANITFDTLPEVGVQHHYVFTLDFVVKEAKMYVDGFLVETKTFTGGAHGLLSPQQYLANGATNYKSWLSIGCDLDNTMSPKANTHYKGVLSNISVHPYLLTNRQVEDLYEFVNVL